MDDEGPGSGEPMPAPDRLWRHPAEAGAEQAAANMAARRAGGRRWPEMVVSFIAGAVFVGLAWLLSDRPPSTVTTFPTNEITPSTLFTTAEAPVGFDEWAFEISQPNRGAVVGLHLGGEAPQPLAQAILYRGDGLLLTSAHSIIGATNISATLPDGRSMPALVLASDPVSGVAVLKIASPELEPAIFSNGAVALRDRLVSIAAHTSGSEPTVQTVDVIGDDHVVMLPNGDLLSGMFRLSTELDSSWAGAPIVDENGGVVAMAVVGPEGANYAIPTGLARRIATDLVENGSTEVDAWLGVVISPLSDSLKEQRGVRGGVLVQRVWSETPAARAGLAAGDVIIGINEINVVDLGDLNQAMSYHAPDERIEVRYVRRDVPAGPDATDNDAEYTAVGSVTTVTLGAQPRRS
jgi:S1-C subfamily serine protease